MYLLCIPDMEQHCATMMMPYISIWLQNGPLRHSMSHLGDEGDWRSSMNAVYACRSRSAPGAWW
jgi:hypothetical protein